MSDTAHDYQTIQPAATEGLDDLFEAEVLPGSTRESVVTHTDGIPVEDAAKILGLSIKTVKDKLRKGTLAGFKTRERYGEKWMVTLGRDYLVIPGSADKDSQVVPGTTERTAADHLVTPELQALLVLLKNKDEALQAAAFRNGYLEAQLAERDQQIKLLTNGQDQNGWWRRTWHWFIGTSTQ